MPPAHAGGARVYAARPTRQGRRVLAANAFRPARRFKERCYRYSRRAEGAEGTYRSSVDAREPQNLIKSEKYQRHLQ
eukprot:370127-Prorocentrum_minimum.AAC.1